jgi:transposase
MALIRPKVSSIRSQVLFGVQFWASLLLERKRPKVVAVARSNKTARIAWALLRRGGIYVAPQAIV